MFGGNSGESQNGAADSDQQPRSIGEGEAQNCALANSSPSPSASSSEEQAAADGMNSPNPPSSSSPCPAAADPAAAYSHCPRAQQFVQKRDFISLLTMGWKKNYNEELAFLGVFDPRNGKDDLEERLQAGPWIATGRARTKKGAQHQAAAKVLLQIVEAGRHKQFLLPGTDAEQARQIITAAIRDQRHFDQFEVPLPAAAPTPAAAQPDRPPQAANEPISLPPQPAPVPMPSPSSPAPASASAKVGGATLQPQQQMQQNWVGRVQEFVQKRRINSRWHEEYSQKGTSGNGIEHCCKLLFHFLDDNREKLEGTGQARSKKSAKQLASRQVLKQLEQLYGEAQQQSGASRAAAKALPTIPPPGQNVQQQQRQAETSAGGQQQQGEGETATDAAVAAGLGPEGLATPDGTGGGPLGNGTGEEHRADVGGLLGHILGNGLRRDAERTLRRILELKEPRVGRLLPRAELKFVGSEPSEKYDVVQVYLELWVTPASATSAAPAGRQLLQSTFGGEGASLEAARDDACWQALQLLHTFGDFAAADAGPEEGEKEGRTPK